MESEHHMTMRERLVSKQHVRTLRKDLKEAVRRLVVSIPWSVFVLAAAMTDLVLCLAALVHPKALPVFFVSDAQITGVILCVYTLDVVMKIIAFSLLVYLRKVGNIVDFSVTAMSIVFVLFEQSATMANGVVALRSPRIARLFFRLAKLGHCFRGVRWTRVALDESVYGARYIVGMNKKRFVDPNHDFDLDLVYIHPRLIGMSVPAKSWLMGLYRNPIMEVVRLFETFHRNNYMIVNCCPELPYPSEYFSSGQVVAFDVQDHTPPTLAQFVEFLNLACDWMSDTEHVLAVHCKGGKGRTGSLCAAWLVYTKEALNGHDACESFALARTDSFRPGHKQTVDTPSQVRYLRHVEALLLSQDAFFPTKVSQPTTWRLKPLRLILDRWFKEPIDDELVVALHQHAPSQSQAESQAASMDSFATVLELGHLSPAFRHDASGSASVELEVPAGFCLQGDVRVSVFRSKPLQKACRHSNRASGSFVSGSFACHGNSLSNSKGEGEGKVEGTGKGKRLVAGTEPGCLFYFMFHTTFVGSDSRLAIQRHEMDKAGKGKHKARYHAEGLCTLEFEVL